MGSRKMLSIVILVIFVAGALLLYRYKQSQAPAIPIGTPVTILVPLGLPPVVAPSDNPPTVETVALGRRLYYDPVLSVDKTISCASCHDPEHGFADGKRFSDGVGGKLGTRNSPTVINCGYSVTQFWDGRAPTLEKQAEGPVQNPVEMAHTLEGVEKRLNTDPSYRAEFERAFGKRTITYEMVGKAIASFERSVVSGNSPFDRYYYGGDKRALSASAQRGLEVFRRRDKANCAVCHLLGDRDALFMDNQFHNIGVGVKNEQPTDLGRYEVTKLDQERGSFKTPSLRNITLTAPYMHDGSLKTLKEVIDFYIGGGNSNPYLDTRIKPLDFLTGQERADLLAFLESLNGTMPTDVQAPITEPRRTETQVK